MAAIAGRLGELWAQSGTASAFTGEACTLVSGTTYKITDAAKRQFDPATTFIVYDGGSPIAATGYTIQYPLGRIVLGSAPAGAVTVTGASFATTEVAFVRGWSLSIKPLIFETTALGATATTGRTYIGGGLPEWSGSLEKLYETDTWAARALANTTGFYLKLYEDEPSDKVWLGLVIFTGWDQTTDIMDLVKEGVEFTGHDALFYISDET